MARSRISDELSNYGELVGLASESYLDKSESAIWNQIYERLANACRNGLLEPGSRLPGEYRLSEIFGVNRITMRKALKRLQEEGLLQARKGAGIFVRPPAQRYLIEHNMRFATSLETGGLVSTRTISVGRRKASAEAQQVYGLSADSETLEIHRIRLLDSNPIYYSVKEFSFEIFPDIEAAYEAHCSVTKVYETHGVTDYRRVETRVTGGFATPEQAGRLSLTENTPVLLVHSKNTDADGRVIELTRGCWPLTSVELIFSNP